LPGHCADLFHSIRRLPVEQWTIQRVVHAGIGQHADVGHMGRLGTQFGPKHPCGEIDLRGPPASLTRYYAERYTARKRWTLSASMFAPSPFATTSPRDIT